MLINYVKLITDPHTEQSEQHCHPLHYQPHLPLAGQRRVGHIGAGHPLQQQFWCSRAILFLRSNAAAHDHNYLQHLSERFTNLWWGFGFAGGDWAIMLWSLFGEIPISLQTPLAQNLYQKSKYIPCYEVGGVHNDLIFESCWSQLPALGGMAT